LSSSYSFSFSSVADHHIGIIGTAQNVGTVAAALAINLIAKGGTVGFGQVAKSDVIGFAGKGAIGARTFVIIAFGAFGTGLVFIGIGAVFTFPVQGFRSAEALRRVGFGRSGKANLIAVAGIGDNLVFDDTARNTTPGRDISLGDFGIGIIVTAGKSAADNLVGIIRARQRVLIGTFADVFVVSQILAALDRPFAIVGIAGFAADRTLVAGTFVVPANGAFGTGFGVAAVGAVLAGLVPGLGTMQAGLPFGTGRRAEPAFLITRAGGRLQFVKSIAAAPAGLSGFIAVGDFNRLKAFADFATGAVVRQAVNLTVVIGAINHAAAFALFGDLNITELVAVGFGFDTEVSHVNGAAGDAIPLGAGFVFANRPRGTFLQVAARFATLANLAFGDAERNTGVRTDFTAVLAVPVALAKIETVGGADIFFAVAAVAGRHSRLALLFQFFFADKSRTGVAAMPEVFRKRTMVIGINNPSGVANVGIGWILFFAGQFLVESAFFVHRLAVEAFVGEFVRLLAFGIDIVV
jgi:hypothetical protein